MKTDLPKRLLILGVGAILGGGVMFLADRTRVPPVISLAEQRCQVLDHIYHELQELQSSLGPGPEPGRPIALRPELKKPRYPTAWCLRASRPERMWSHS
jgi:hypothetical protein